MITLGGSDFRNLLPLLIEGLCSENFEFTVIAGNNINAENLKKTYGNSNLKILGYLNGDQMKGLMLENDIVISACGQTLHELTYLGVPYIGICLDKDQIPNMLKYHSLGILSREIYWDDKNLISILKDEIQNLSYVKKRDEISSVAIKSISAQGVENITRVVLNEAVQ